MVDNLSPNGAKFIASFEGFVPTCYDDGGKPGVGHCTVGYGHLVHYGPTTPADKKKWGTLTRKHGLELLHADAQAAVFGVKRYIKIPLRQWQFDALVSFAYNCGAGALNGQVGTAVNSKPKKWNVIAIRRWRKRVQDALLLWTKSGGKDLPGLVRRRRAEGNLFASGKYGA